MRSILKAAGKGLKRYIQASDELSKRLIQESDEFSKRLTLTFGKKCPKCDSRNLNKVKPGFWSKYMFASTALFSGAGRQPKTLNVCRDCGFSWEDR